MLGAAGCLCRFTPEGRTGGGMEATRARCRRSSVRAGRGSIKMLQAECWPGLRLARCQPLTMLSFRHRDQTAGSRHSQKFWRWICPRRSCRLAQRRQTRLQSSRCHIVGLFLRRQLVFHTSYPHWRNGPARTTFARSRGQRVWVSFR